VTTTAIGTRWNNGLIVIVVLNLVPGKAKLHCSGMLSSTPRLRAYQTTRTSISTATTKNKSVVSHPLSLILGLDGLFEGLWVDIGPPSTGRLLFLGYANIINILIGKWDGL
jgi:hypothetical protein